MRREGGAFGLESGREVEGEEEEGEGEEGSGVEVVVEMRVSRPNSSARTRARLT